ncbi:MAG: polyprenyl synthetase family protein [Desulfobulbaceae bacterium]|nr:MAG: polyprenyl synthetase family protein [Desulfobulbaceae bacterium]
MTGSANEILMAIIRKEAGQIDAAMQADIDGLTARVDQLLVDVLRYSLFNGGKRIRPLLTVLAARLCGRDDPEIYQLARAFEYLHAATLMHDDVIDNADTRRGRPSVHVRFGTVAAILAGDYLHARSMAIVGALAGSEALNVLSDATGRMVDGEFLQVRNASCFNLSEEDYQRAILEKTGLLIAAACEVGALWAGGTEEQRNAVREYGLCLGSAFQVIDDLLDYQGKTSATGKRVGNDLVEGKMTYPLIVTVKRAEKSDRERLCQIIGEPALRRIALDEVTGLILKYDGFHMARKKAEDMAIAALEPLAIFSDLTRGREKKAMQGLVQYVLSREK